MILVKVYLKTPSTIINDNNTTYLQEDFTKINFLRRAITTHNNLLIILGNTIANEIDIEKYLYNLRQISNNNSYLLIGIELLNFKTNNSINKIKKEYNCPENKALTISPLKLINIPIEKGKIKIVFNKEKHRIEETFVFKEDLDVNTSHGPLKFKKDYPLILSITYKPNFSILNKMFNNSGWELINYKFINNQYLLLLRSK